MNRVLFNIIYPLLHLVSLLPLKLLYGISSFLAFIISKIFRYREYVVYTNLARAFPDLKYWDLQKISHEFYRYLSDVMVETLWASSASASELVKLVNVKNPEVLSDIVNRYGNAIVVMGHQGNWELISALAENPAIRTSEHYGNADFVIAYKKLDNKVFDKVFHKIRMAGYEKFRATGTIVESAELFRYVLSHRDRKSVYFMIADQTTPHPKLIADFLNQKTAVFNGPEYISRKLGYPVVYLNNDRVSRGKYEITYTVITENPASCKEGEISGKFFRMLENGINANKPNWLWSHKRWKKNFDRNDQRLSFL